MQLRETSVKVLCCVASRVQKFSEGLDRLITGVFESKRYRLIYLWFQIPDGSVLLRYAGYANLLIMKDQEGWIIFFKEHPN